MLNFRNFVIIEDKKKQLRQMISLSVEQFRQDMKTFTETGIKSSALIILESARDVTRLTKVDVKQTEQNDRALMKKFVEDFKKLKSNEQAQLVEKLKQPINGKNYILNNNEIKLILIYRNNPESYIGQEAYNAVVMNKENLFKQAAQEKVMKGQLRADQAADYVQEMFLTLCGGGDYNEKNGGKYSLDIFDPFVYSYPFNNFIKTRVIPAAFNKFQANYSTSVSNDFAVAKKGANVISTDETIGSDDSDDKDLTVGDTIQDTSEAGRDAADLTDERMKKALLNKALNDPSIPKQYRLTEKEKQMFKDYFLRGKSKLDTMMAAGISKNSSRQLGRTYLGTDKEDGKDGTIMKKVMGAIKWLQLNKK